MRICILYDCLFPCTIGGAERWYRNLAERLAAAGHEVTYLTLRQWDETAPVIRGVAVRAVGPRLDLYSDGRRRIWPPMRFGIGVFLHLARHGRKYDVVHTASFPFFSLLAAGLLRPFMRYHIGVDWHEVWSDAYWRTYLGKLGWAGIAAQRFCSRIRQRAYSFSRLHLGRLEQLDVNGPTALLPGEYSGHAEAPTPAAKPHHIVYAGRLIPEKRVPLLVEALALAMRELPDLHATIFGRGPELPAIEALISRLGLSDRIDLPGFVEQSVIDAAMRGAVAIVQPSMREGYGMVVVEAGAYGVPAVVVEAEDNAAVELIEDGVNGFVTAPATAEALARRLLACVNGGEALRASTRDWYAANAKRLSIGHSIDIVMADMQERDLNHVRPRLGR